MKVRYEEIAGTGAHAEILETPGLRVLCISDVAGMTWPQQALFKDVAPARFAELAETCPPGSTDAAAGTIPLNFNIFVIQTQGQTIVVDAGLGNGKTRKTRPAWADLNTPFLRILSAFGITPDKVDMLILTHFHTDHMGWATRREGEHWVRTFPNARYIAPEREIARLEQQAAQTADTSTLLHGAYDDSYLPVAESGGWEAAPVPSVLTPVISLEPAPGHLPGLAMLRLNTPKTGQTILLCSDAIHHHIQLADPTIVSNFCADPAQAVATRRAILAAEAGNDTVIAAYHFPHPAFGRVRVDGASWRFEPLAGQTSDAGNGDKAEHAR